MLENYEIWEAFAKYSAILEDSVVSQLLEMFQYFINEDNRKFDAAKKFWHIRLGPGCPKEWISQNGIKFIKDWEKLYLQKIFFKFKGKQLEIETEVLYKFAILR